MTTGHSSQTAPLSPTVIGRTGEGAADCPVEALFAPIVGQPEAVTQLRASARHPVHAYLFRGSSETTRAASRSFAAALLCSEGGCGQCGHCRRAMAGSHPDLLALERTGASLTVDEARRLAGLSLRRPLESSRQVIVLPDADLATRAAPALLKTVEEPPASTVFVLLAQDVPRELVAVASRCVEVLFPPVSSTVLVDTLVERGTDRPTAEAIAEGAGGDFHRAALLAEDPTYRERQAFWRSVPDRLDGSGAMVWELSSSALAATETALDPLRQRHASELATLDEEAKSLGGRGGTGRKIVVERQHREERRWRTDELKAGLGVLARAYRDRMMASLAKDALTSTARHGADATTLINESAASLEHNPNESLLLEALFVRLGAVPRS